MHTDCLKSVYNMAELLKLYVMKKERLLSPVCSEPLKPNTVLGVGQIYGIWSIMKY